MIPDKFKSHNSFKRVAAIFVMLSAMTPVAQAKEHRPPENIKVISTLSLDNKQASDMFIEQVGGKPYLYVLLANGQGAVAVDISRPQKPKIVGAIPSVDAVAEGRLSVSGNAAIVSAANPSSYRTATTGELALWDISEPHNPRLVQRFSGVVRVLQDERNYTYVLNREGLSVVYDRQNTADESWDFPMGA